MKRLRLSIDLTQEQSEFLIKLPYGWRQRIYSNLTDMLINHTHIYGSEVLTDIISQKLNLRDYFTQKDG